ncbi:MAG: branched-chain amino acid ABC transporter permease [Anaerolineaceae bacterium]
MDTFLQLITSALLVSSLYTLVAIGFTMYVGVINLANFSHGDTCVLGTFILMPLFLFAAKMGWITSLAGITIPLMMVLVILLSGLWGVGVYKGLVKPLLGAPRLILLLASVAAGQVIREAIRVFYPNGSNPQVFPKLLPKGGFEISGFVFGFDTMIIIFLTIICIFGLNFIIQKTKMGLAMRSVSQNADVAQMMGINIEQTIIAVFIIGSALAGLAGILNGTYYGITKFNLGSNLGIKGFSAAVIGGLGDFKGAVIGGLLLGFIEVFASAYIPNGSQFQDVFSFLAVIAFLIFRPNGILGEKIFEKV